MLNKLSAPFPDMASGMGADPASGRGESMTGLSLSIVLASAGIQILNTKWFFDGSCGNWGLMSHKGNFQC